MQYIPKNYEQINVMAGTTSPAMIKAYNNETFAFWERALFQRAMSVIELNVEWQGAKKDFLYYCLFRYGYVSIFDNDKYGFSYQPCTLKGYDFYYQPTDVIVTNPALITSLEMNIGTDCELLKLTPDYMGIWDIIEYTAYKLSLLDTAINMSIINNKFARILAPRNKAAAEALKKILDKINKGEPAVLVDKVLLNDKTDKDSPLQDFYQGNLKSSYITTDQLMDFQTLLNNFDTEIGIPTIPYQKKERLVTDEANSKQLEASARSSIWVNTLNNSFDIINKHYGTNMSAKLRYDIKGEIADE